MYVTFLIYKNSCYLVLKKHLGTKENTIYVLF